VLDADVKNSTFTEDFKKAIPERFIECYIAEQNMISAAAGLSRIGKMPVVATFGAFLVRAADQIRMARVSEANIKFVGSHVGVSIGEDGPSQMALEDIAMFGAMPGTIIFQPADGISASKLTELMLNNKGFVYIRTLRPKTKMLYGAAETFHVGGSKILKQSDNDQLTIAATGITVFEALAAADKLKEENINVRVLDCYCINPVDKTTLLECINSTKQPTVITVEDHFAHGGFGDFVAATLSQENHHLEKMAVTKISQSGTKDELLKDAGIDAGSIVEKVKKLLQ
jgi:transketolase